MVVWVFLPLLLTLCISKEIMVKNVPASLAEAGDRGEVSFNFVSRAEMRFKGRLWQESTFPLPLPQQPGED